MTVTRWGQYLTGFALACLVLLALNLRTQPIVGIGPTLVVVGLVAMLVVGVVLLLLGKTRQRQ
jgi:hypothetical protein